jgi:hypothetical protein
VQASNVLFDLGCVDGGRTFMKVATTSLDVQDLRPAYRLQQFVRQSRRLVAQAEAEEAGEGMVTPPSHFSDSGHSTPRAADGERERSGVARAAAAGSEAAADSLAPPEVRQRLLSDAAAEMLLDELDEEQRAALVRGRSPAAAVAERGASWARAAESAQEGDGAAVDGGAALDDPLEPLYRAAQAATQRLHRQPSDAPTLARPSPPSTLGTGGRGGGRAYGADGEEGSTPGTLADTPATPSTGGFTFMLPDSRHGPPAVTPGLLSADSEGLAAGSGLPPGIAAEGHRAHGDPNPHTGIRLSGALPGSCAWGLVLALPCMQALSQPPMPSSLPASLCHRGLLTSSVPLAAPLPLPARCSGPAAFGAGRAPPLHAHPQQRGCLWGGAVGAQPFPPC